MQSNDNTVSRALTNAGETPDPTSGETDPAPVSKDELEHQLILSLEDNLIQERIKALLQKTVREELSKMSVVMREAVRNWVFKEKQKYNLTPADEIPDETGKLEQVEADRKQLEEENLKLKRALELKEHENKIMLSAIKKMVPKPN